MIANDFSPFNLGLVGLKRDADELSDEEGEIGSTELKEHQDHLNQDEDYFKGALGHSFDAGIQ